MYSPHNNKHITNLSRAFLAWGPLPLPSLTSAEVAAPSLAVAVSAYDGPSVAAGAFAWSCLLQSGSSPLL